MRTLSIATLLIVSSISWTASAADRRTDKALARLIAQIASEEDAFRDALDPTLKRATLRSPAGEVDVERFLRDFSDAAEHLEDRFGPEYSASTEAADLLRRASTIDAYFKRDQAGGRGESEWNRFATRLAALAGAYGTTFPLPADPVVRRISDREVLMAADQLARDADRLKDALEDGLDQNRALDKNARRRIVQEADRLKHDARALRDAVDDDKPASAQADTVLTRLGSVREAVTTSEVRQAAELLPQIEAHGALISRAFGAPAVATRAAARRTSHRRCTSLCEILKMS